MTTRGMKEKQMKEIAGLIHGALTGGSTIAIKREVQVLCRGFQ